MFSGHFGSLIKGAGIILLASVMLILLAIPFPGEADQLDTLDSGGQLVRIGVLARRGSEECLQSWCPTADFLDRQITGFRFQIVPLAFEEVVPSVQAKDVDFVIVNSSIYVELQALFGAARIATMKDPAVHYTSTVFGGVIFTRADRSDIESINDLKGKSFTGVDETSLGGWRAAWREFKAKGIDPYKDFSKLLFSGTHDAVVYAVLDGKVDAGTVATPILERMATEGKIEFGLLKVINAQEHADFPYVHSTRLYPNWPFAKMKHTSNALAEKIVIALLSMPQDSPAALASGVGGWTVPLDYGSVDECLRELRIGIYKDFGKITIADVLHNYKWQIATALLAIIGLTGLLLLTLRLNLNLRTSKLALQNQIYEREHAEAEAAEKERKYRELFETANDGIFLSDETGFVDCNQRGADMYGLAREDIIGLHPADLCPERQPDGRFSSEVANEKTVAALNGGPQSFQWQYIRFDGLVMDAEISLNRVEVGGAVLLQAIVRDVTERKRTEEERRSLEERLQRAEKMEALGTLAGGVAHDLNNVLGVVVGYSELLLYAPDVSSSTKSKATEILKAGQKAAAIVQDLLTLARRGIQNRDVLNLNRVILESQRSPEFAKVLTYHLNIKVKTDLEKDLLNISGSSVHLEKSFINLVSNAVEAMPEGGTLTIKTGNQYLDKPVSGYDSVREGDYVVLSVSDTGEGISTADLKRIFEPFYTKKIMGRSGTGLGLAVVWGMVKDHHGYINVESEEGIGTTVTLYFPVTREDITPEQVSASAAEYMGNSEFILVVDDIKEQRELAMEMLTKQNYKVTTVSSGEEALEYLKLHQVDLVVLDMIMDPGMDGLDTYAKILEIHPGQKAIIVSGFSETERVNKAQAFGAGAYVKKPYVLEKLGLAVRKELDKPA